MNENFNIETLPITDQIKSYFEEIIDLLGENKNREGLLKTPERASKALKFLQRDMRKIRNKYYKVQCFKKTIMKWLL